ncbi:hypothetical protein [Streptomyces sp. NPDC048428]|uniref:hypothetical protein n=1 Tax=Streptomyces sp. NPDC048428 TaxID=3154503 RepID=UPI003418A269
MVLIKGRDNSPLVAGEPLLTRPGFWSNYLLAMCDWGTNAVRPTPAWFGDDAADTDALAEVLFDPERWPVFRVPAGDGPGVVVIYRNLVDDFGIDYLLTHPGQSPAQQIASWEGDLSGTGLTWRELDRIAAAPSPRAEGVEDAAARLLLILPLLDDLDVPATARTRLSIALVSTGTPQRAATKTAQHLLTHLLRRSGHDPLWGSPLSGNGRAPGSGRHS